MARNSAILPVEAFRFFRELGRNNNKPWMDANRQRYRTVVVEPFRRLLDTLTPAVLKLNPAFEVTGRTGMNFSRINRDIRFANDKSPYRLHYYLFFSMNGRGRVAGQLYVGVSADLATAGFRIYYESRESALSQIGIPRAQQNRAWLARMRSRLAPKYEGYWYSSEKGEWTKRSGWPIEPAEWKRLKGWIVRRKFSPAAAARPAFASEISRIFRELYPLYRFTASSDWHP